jgi:hypothetical protein
VYHRLIRPRCVSGPVEFEGSNCLLHMLYPVQKPYVGFREFVRSRPFPQQRDVAQGRLTINIFALSDVRDGRDHPTIAVLGLDLDMAIAAPRYSFRRIQSNYRVW